MAQPGWIAEERFATNRARLAHKAELFDRLMPILRTRTRADWIERFEAAGVPCAPVHSVPEALAHPQVQALGMLAPVPGGDFDLTALPLCIDGHRPLARGLAPRLGQHNARNEAPPPADPSQPETP